MTGNVIPAEYEGSLCEIKTIENTFLTTARISSVSPDKMKFQVKGKAVRSVRFGTRLKINIINSRLGFRVIEGKVFTYSFGTLTVTDIFSIVEKERRKSLRVDMNVGTKASFENSFTGKTAFADITIKNMSVNGVKFTSRQHFDMGSTVLFSLDLKGRHVIDLSCTVIRRGAEVSDGDIGYIGKFGNASSREDEICSFLLQKQGELYGKSK